VGSCNPTPGTTPHCQSTSPPVLCRTSATFVPHRGENSYKKDRQKVKRVVSIPCTAMPFIAPIFSCLFPAPSSVKVSLIGGNFHTFCVYYCESFTIKICPSVYLCSIMPTLMNDNGGSVYNTGHCKEKIRQGNVRAQDRMERI
jgi:hypothetical protein